MSFANRNREDAALVGRGPDPAGSGEDGAALSCLAARWTEACWWDHVYNMLVALQPSPLCWYVRQAFLASHRLALLRSCQGWGSPVLVDGRDGLCPFTTITVCGDPWGELWPWAGLAFSMWRKGGRARLEVGFAGQAVVTPYSSHCHNEVASSKVLRTGQGRGAPLWGCLGRGGATYSHAGHC